MQSATRSQRAVEVLHYVTPISIFCYYTVATTVGVCTLQTLAIGGTKGVRTAVLWTMSTVLILYICQAGMILSQLASGHSLLATTDSNIYALASTLVWFVLTVTLLGSANNLWYPYQGSWVLAFISEAIVYALQLRGVHSSTGVEQALIVVQALRLLLLFCLPLSTFVLGRIGSTNSHTDVEAAPLLTHSQDVSGESQESAKYGSTSTPGRTGTTSETDVDDEDEEIKAERAELEKIQKRLEQSGNWWTYVRGFSIFLPCIWPTKKPRLQLNMLGVGLCLAAIRVLNVLVPRQFGLVVNSLGQSATSHPLAELAIYILLSTLDSDVGIRALRGILWVPVESNAYQSIECASYNHIMSLSSDFHDSKRSGELYTAMWQGRSVIDLLEKLLYELVPQLIDLFVACIFVYYLFDVYMVLIVTSTMVMYLWLSVLLTVIQTSVRRRNQFRARRKYHVMYDTIGSWKTIAYFNGLRRAQDSYYASTAAYTKSRQYNMFLYYFARGVQGLVLDVGLFGACFYAAYQIIYNKQSVGQFVTLFTYWVNLSSPLSALSSAHKELLEKLVDAEQLLILFNTKPTVTDGLGRLRLQNGQVTFNHVKFTYDGKKQVINDVTFDIAPGKTVALIGETGGGKSTILKLLFRFYDIAGGSIRIDGQDIRTVSLESLREHIGVVPQDPSLFNETIMHNVRYSRVGASDEEVMGACRAAAIHDKIMSFTNGYMSKVGENGVKLSGGELQRIAIARAILKDPKIILLDEATSSVDSETEGEIQEALKKLSSGRTTFVVAHRLSTIVDADLILVIKDGAILEQGPPAELLRSKGKYYRLWTKQMGIQDVSDHSGDGSAESGGKENGDVLGTNKDGHRGKDSNSTSKGEKSQSETEKGSLNRKRPDLHKGSSSKNKNVFSAIGKKMFRPDAPEFVPQYQRGTAASGSQDDSHQHDSSAHDHGHDATSGKTTGAEKRQKSRKRKAKQDSQAADSGHPPNVDTTLDGSSDAQNAAEHADKKDKEPTAKRSRFNRRLLSKSEPPNQSLQRSQGDGTSEFDGTQMGSREARPMTNTSRRVTAPSDPPSGPSTGQNSNFGPRRRRQRHWRDRHPEQSSTSGTRSSSSGQDCSSDARSTERPTVPFTSPAGGVTPMNELARAGGVRFAPGS